MNATEVKTYRGRTLEEVLPKIKAELGPDAEIVRQRSGLTGGVGGFFQRSMVEVEARSPQPAARRRRFDAYDDSPAMPEPYVEPEPEAEPDLSSFVPDTIERTAEAEGLSAPGIQEILRQAAPFADALNAASEELAPAPEPTPPATRDLRPATPAPQAELPTNAETMVAALKDGGLDADFARGVVAEVVDHELPFASPRSLKRLVRRALARRIPTAPAAPAGARSIAFVGPGGAGKTLCTARLAAAYARGSSLPVVVVSLRSPDGGAELRTLLEPHGIGVRAVDSGAEARAHLVGAVEHAVVVVDTPAVAPRSTAEVAALADELSALGVDEVHLALPSTYSGPAARELTELLAPLAPSRLALTHMDATTHVGGLIDYAIREQRPISYVAEGSGVPGGLEPADADTLAALVLP